MASAGERLRTRARRLWRWLFPEEVALAEEDRRTVAAVYPALDLRRVSFHRGLPHLLKGGAQGMVLPAALSPRRCRVYIAPRGWRGDSVADSGLLLHEAFHALQVQESGPGLGALHPFLVLYLACAARNGFLYSHRHPMEADAYRLAGRRSSLFESRTAAGGLNLTEIATPTSGLAFWRKLARSTPGHGTVFVAPMILLWLPLWTAVVALLWAARLLVEGVGAATAAVLWLAGSLLRLLRL